MFSREPVLRLSIQSTLQPSERSRSQRWLPRKPPPPVTSARGLLLTTPKTLVGETGLEGRGGVEDVAPVHQELGRLHEG